MHSHFSPSSSSVWIYSLFSVLSHLTLSTSSSSSCHHLRYRQISDAVIFIREEADELCQTLEDNEEKKRAVSEMADVLYHAMVLLKVKDVKMEDVLRVLRDRFSQSGIEEKNRRK